MTATAQEIAVRVLALDIVPGDGNGEIVPLVGVDDPEALQAAVAATLGDEWLVWLVTEPEGIALNIQRWSAKHMAMLAPTFARERK